MTTIPPIKNGLGAITPEVWDVVRQAAMFFNENKTRLTEALTMTDNSSKPRNFFMAKITGHERLDASPTDASYRWKYSWEEVEPADPTDTTGQDTVDDTRYKFVAKTNGLTSTVTTDGEDDAFANYAINTIECANANSIAGPGIKYTLLDDYQLDSIRPRPIGGVYDGVDGSGAENDYLSLELVVPMFFLRDTTGALRFYFSAVNAFDGRWCT
tara:strand:- start:10848 stop:11486 length:639 start_codon:yes stop_codon:yes gene_type:complete